jgi:hypothetical protein
MLQKVYYPREGQEPKELTPSSQKELDALIRIGWKLKGDLNVPSKAVPNSGT